MAHELARTLGAAVVNGDDFYAGGTFAEWARKMAAEKATYCVDWQRLRVEALEPLRSGRPATWRPYNWETLVGLSSVTKTCDPAPIIILDGAYSSRPELADLLDLTVLVRLPDPIRLERLVLLSFSMAQTTYPKAIKWDLDGVQVMALGSAVRKS